MTEREKIVAWLRERALDEARYANSITPRPIGSDNEKLFMLYHRDAGNITDLAEAIERGDHLK